MSASSSWAASSLAGPACKVRLRVRATIKQVCDEMDVTIHCQLGFVA